MSTTGQRANLTAPLAAALLLLALSLWRPAEARAQWTSGGGKTTTQDNVGIGTGAPTEKLHVPARVRFGNILFGESRPGGTEPSGETVESLGHLVLTSQPGYEIKFGHTGAPPLMTLNSAGNLGIGTAEPDKRLVVMDGVDLYLKFLRSNNKGLYLYSNGDYNGINAADFSNGAFLPLSVGWGADVYLARDGGRVGVGTTNVSHTLEVNGTINASQGITGATISATFQDVAEWVPSVQKLSAGTVVVLDSGRTNHVMASGKAYDTKVAGVVSAEPGVILGTGGEGRLKVATTGRVKVRVDATRAPIEVGDLLVTSGAEGVAMKSIPVDLGGVQMHRPGTIIGKALEPLEKGTGEILVLLSLQ